MSQNSLSSAVKVLIRVRPLVKSQNLTKNIVEVQSDSQTLRIYLDQINKIQSKFDHVIRPQLTQIDVFSQFSPYIPKIFQGFNMTIFAYGQTGSGKTYTMFGSDWQNIIQKNVQAKKQNTYFSNLQNDTNFAGIIPRSINAIFNEFQKSPLSYQLYCSFLQIYNQKIYDLLQDSPTPKALIIHESKTNGIFVEGLTEFQVQHFADCIELMRKGQKNRFIRQTSMNAKSSRSHTIFQILVESMHTDANGNLVKARLNLCDLAGSQKINKKQSMVNEHLQELKNINLSLTTLGKVISSLSKGEKKQVASFRQSKLTRLLQESLTVNTNTFIIGNISPSEKNFDQTLNTLKFAQRASHITMKIKPIQMGQQQNSQSINKLKKQVQYLKQLLNLKRKGLNQDKLTHQLDHLENENSKLKNHAVSATQYQRIMEQNKKMKQQIHHLQNNLEKVQQQLNSSLTESSQKSYSHYRSSDYSANQEVRNDIYKERFIKKANQIGNKERYRQSRNRSVLVNAGMATIQHPNHENQKEIQWANKHAKHNILDKLQKMQEQRSYNDSLIMQQLQNFKQKKQKKPLLSKNSKSIDLSEIQKKIPKRVHQANVFRKPKASYQRSNVAQQIFSNRSPQKKQKLDYGNRIKQLQARLYKK